MEIDTNEKLQVFTFNVSYKLQQTKRDYMDTEVNLSLTKTVSFEIHTDFQ